MASSLHFPLLWTAHLIQHGRGMYFDGYLRSAFAAAKHGAKRTGRQEKKDRNTIPKWAQNEPKVTWGDKQQAFIHVSSAKNMIPKTGSVDDYKQCDINIDFASAGTKKKRLGGRIGAFSYYLKTICRLQQFILRGETIQFNWALCLAWFDVCVQCFFVSLMLFLGVSI